MHLVVKTLITHSLVYGDNLYSTYLIWKPRSPVYGAGAIGRHDFRKVMSGTTSLAASSRRKNETRVLFSRAHVLPEGNIHSSKSISSLPTFVYTLPRLLITSPKVHATRLFLLVIVCLGKPMLVITFNKPITVTMSLVFSVHASFALPDEFSRTGVYGSTFFDLATLLKSPNQAAQAPAMSTIMFISVSNSPMVLEKKIVSTASLSCLPIILLTDYLALRIT
ncbi:hypothetical protein YC2023_095504 [Brassica napus]